MGKNIYMPREDLNEIIIRLAVNALAYAIDNGHRQPPTKGSTPEWVDRHRSAPGGPLIAQLAQDYADLEGAKTQLAIAEHKGWSVAATLKKIERLERKIKESLGILGEIKSSSHIATSGPWVCKIDAHQIQCKTGTHEYAGMTLYVPVLPEEWDWLEEWRHSDNDRPRENASMYRFDPIKIKDEQEENKEQEPVFKLKLRENVEIPAAIFRRAVIRQLKITVQYSKEQIEYWKELQKQINTVSTRVNFWQKKFPNIPHPPTIDSRAVTSA